ncbi:MAG: hypothetical protein U0169_21635 [Polyangiaceae bacterium]
MGERSARRRTASAALAWIVLVPTAVALASRGYGKDVPRAIMLKRVPGAAFFFVLLALHARDDLPLVAYAVAFVPPYLALMAKRPALPSRSGTGAAKADR